MDPDIVSFAQRRGYLTSSSLTATALHKTCVPNLSLAMTTRSSLRGFQWVSSESTKLSRQTLGFGHRRRRLGSVHSLDLLNEFPLIIRLAFLKKLLAEVIAAGGEAKGLGPFKNGVNEHNDGFRVTREGKAGLHSR